MLDSCSPMGFSQTYLPPPPSGLSILKDVTLNLLPVYRYGHPMRVVEQGNYNVIVVTECSGVQYPVILMVFIP